MKESDKEGLATRLGRESWACRCEAMDQALTAEHAGRNIELRNQQSRKPTQLHEGEGHIVRGELASRAVFRRSRGTQACVETP